MIAHYKGNEIVAIECHLCPQPILPGKLYMSNGGPAAHYTCWLTKQATNSRPNHPREGLDR